jgi:hypothetical protein
LCSSVQCYTQENSNFELRTNFIHQHYLSKGRFWIRNDVGYRHYFEETPYSMLLLRPRAIIELAGILDLHPGVDFRLSTYSELPSTLEIRTWQGLSVSWPDVGRFMFDHFYRFEQRFYWTEGVPDEEIGFRSRYRLRMRVPVNNRTITDQTFFMDLRGEVYLPHDKEIGELFATLIRLGATLAYQQNSRWRYQVIGYFDGGRNTLEDERTVTRSIVELRVRAMF